MTTGRENRVENVIKTYKDDRIKYFFNDIQGPSAARNFGITVASGSYIAFLDDDDEFLPQKIEKQLLNIYPQTSFYWTYGAGKLVRTNGTILYKPKYKLCSNLLLGVYCQVLMPSVLLRSECFLKSNLFEVSIHNAEDWSVWYRISCKFKVKATDDLVYIVHNEHGQKRLSENQKIIDGILNFKAKHFSNLTIIQKMLFLIKNQMTIKKLKKQL